MACMDCFLREPPVRRKDAARTLGKMAQLAQQNKSSPFQNYAAEFLFHHLSQSRASDDEIFDRVNSFLSSSRGIFSWVEHVAGHLELQKVYQAGKIITQLLERRAQHSPPIGLNGDLSRMNRWANDLPHLVIRFGRQLLSTPSSIHDLIPPFCPVGSAIRDQHVSNRGVTVQGINSQDWDEYLSTISYYESEEPTTTLMSSASIAVGKSAGKVILYDDKTFQELQVVELEEPVWTATFSADGKLLAVASSRAICVWSVDSGVELHKFVKTLCSVLAFDEDGATLWAAMRNNLLLCLDTETGDL